MVLLRRIRLKFSVPSPSGSSGTLTFLIDPDLYKKEDGRDAPTCAPD